MAPGRVLFALIAALGLAACGGVDDDTPSGSLVIPDIEWQLAFEDEFEGDSLDTTKWNIDTGDGCPDLCGWGNNEKQVYSEDNITVAGGILTIQGRQEADGTYTSGRVNSKGKFDFRYGKVEVSARLPAGQGAWPAIWMLHSDPTIYGPWPLSGEIDIVEGFNLGVDGNTATQSTAHYGLATPPYDGTSSKYDTGVSPDMGFRVYTLEWERDKLRFFVDGQHFQTQNAQNWYTYFPEGADGFYDEFGPYDIGSRDAPFDQLFHLIMNFAIGGNPVGDPDPGAFPQNFEIDYVRVYECANANPETGRGCGVADPDVVPLKDNDGGPLEERETAQPYLEALALYIDGPETIEVTVGEETATNMLQVDGFTGEGASVINDPAFTDPDDPENTVWRFAVSGGVANAYLASQDLTDDPILDTGFDFSGNRLGGIGEDPVGEVVFDMWVEQIDVDAKLLIKLDSGFPNLGEMVLPSSELAIGAWKTYSVKFDMFLENPGFVDQGGEGVNLENVVNPFVIEVQDGSAEVYLDNISVTNACKVVGGCGADPRTKGLPDVVVYDDAVNTGVWGRGIVASDSGTGFVDYTDGTDPANKVNWREIDADEEERGRVIEVTFNDSDAFGVWFIGSAGTDLTAYNAGSVQFDVKVLDYGDNTEGMTFKIDCFFPCTSGDKALGFIADGEWETVTFPVSRLPVGAPPPGFDLSNVNTGIVLFPTTQAGGITFLVDNIRWVSEGGGELPLAQIDLPVTFEDPLVDYTLTDFGDPVAASTVLGEDPDDAGNTVAITT
ncbi:MAG: glycoside hydrolase family 16 protein, partial [Chromatiales bacterium]